VCAPRVSTSSSVSRPTSLVLGNWQAAALGNWQAAALAPPPPGTIRDRAGEILGRPEFEHHKSLLERVAEWIGDQLNRFSFGAGGGPGFFGDLLGLVFVAGAIVLLVVLVRTFRRSARRPQDDDVTMEHEARRSATDWRTDAERFEAEGKWREAMRARYRELVRTLVDDGLLSDVPGRTTGEYRAEIATSMPARAEAFAELTELFEVAWYGGRAIREAELRRFRALAASVRGPRQTERVLVDAP
jgi:hypothetical protein